MASTTEHQGGKEKLMEFSAEAIIGIISLVIGIFTGVISAIIRFRERLIRLELKIGEIKNLKDTVESLREENLRMEGKLYALFRLKNIE